MRFEKLSLLMVIMALAASHCIGCSGRSGASNPGSGLPAAYEGLQDLSALLQALEMEGKAIPSSADQFRQYDVVHPAAGIMIPNGTLVYFQGGRIDPKMTEPTLVAMQADADKAGGWVLLGTGELKELTPEEVQSLTPAGNRAK